MAIDIVDLPIDTMVIFHSFLYVYQRVTLHLVLYPLFVVDPHKALPVVDTHLFKSW